MKDKNQVPKRRGRPIGSHNQTKTASFTTVPKQLAAKIEYLSIKTGVSRDRIALCALVDGLRNWEGIHETLINYNASVDTIIRESGTPAKRKAAPVQKTDGNVIAQEKEREREIETELRDLGPSKSPGGATHISPDDDALLGRNATGESDGAELPFDAAIHGE